jgi:sugar lactone lactonase YvrE
MPSSTSGSTGSSMRSRRRSFAAALIASAFLLALFAASASATEAQYAFSFGSKGSGNGQFSTPKGSAIDKEGNVWVVDSGNNRVERFAGSNGAYLSKCGSTGSGKGQLSGPSGVAIDSAGNLWVTDKGNNRVEKFSSSCEYLSQFAVSEPEAIAIDAGGNLWVVDRANRRVQKFNSKGEFLSQFGSEGSGNGQFNVPSGIAVDGAGNLWVTDTKNSRVQKFNSKGEYLSQFGTNGAGNGQLSLPEGNIGIDSGGMLWVADTGNNRIQEFTPKGEYFAQFGSKGSGSGQFNAPRGVSVDSVGSLFVADQGNNRAQKWSRPPAVPANVELPVVSPTNPHVGTVLSATTGAWTAAPNNYEYQWYRGGGAIAGATSATYIATEADVGWALSAKVTAIDSESSETGTATSNATSQVTSETRYWYANGEKLATKTPTAYSPKATSNFVMVLTVPGGGWTISCTTISSESGTVENPPEAEIGVFPPGTASGNLLLSGCTVTNPTKCTVSNPLLNVSGLATELEGASAVKFTGTAAWEAMTGVQFKGESCAYNGQTFTVGGSFKAVVNPTTSTFAVTKASSNLHVGLGTVTLEGTSKFETSGGKVLTVAP